MGDLIRIVRIPSLFSEAHYHNGEWEETFSLYRQLIADEEVLPISEIDDTGRPWIEYESIDEQGASVSHALAMDDDSWEYVR
ncbi:hypothetical protein [Gimesia maris]|uniref:hypothetical protein n=1 Tax=Gimesia maris TaxID=122 RepID=UPI003A935B5C